MDIISLIVGASWTFVGLVLIGLSIPLVRGQIGPNGAYGVRFPQSFQSDEAWFAINRFGGWCLIAWAVPIILIGIACFFLPLQSHTRLTLILGFAPLSCLLTSCLQAWRFALRYGPRE